MTTTLITVRKELYAPAPDEHTSERRSQRYANGVGLRRIEHRSLQRESDWSNADYERYSDDNGRTWSAWQDVHQQHTEVKGEDEVNTYTGAETFNLRYGHFVALGMRRIFLSGHTRAYKAYWERGEASFRSFSVDGPPGWQRRAPGGIDPV
ncbi:MAG: hypothetical protein ACYDCO_05555 [Armatimonadota bacterium]